MSEVKYDIAAIKTLLGASRYNLRADSWFLPGDLVAHSSKFKYACKRLHEIGKLERRGNSFDRWGYSYKIKQ